MPTKKNKTDSNPFQQIAKRRWGNNEKRQRSRFVHRLERLRIEKPLYWWRERTVVQRIIIGIVMVVFVSVTVMFSVGQWYVFSNRKQPIQLGTTFIPSYARYYDLDPHETLHALIYDAGFRHFRLVSYWDEIEKTPGNYDFSELDWQFKMAEETNSKVSLAIGLRQPRWPECHMPGWASQLPKDEWSIYLKNFMGKVIDRYKTSPALQSYQLENEFFMSVFGNCPDFSRERLVDEFNYVKQQDAAHPVIISRSNNAVGLPLGDPTPDMFGISVYKRVWDKTLTKRYFEYPFPSWFYSFLAGGGKIMTGKDMMIHELQTEAWLPDNGKFSMNDPNDIPEQNKSLDAKRLHDRIEYGKATGMKTIDLWGAEWWYWRKVKANDPSLWNTVKAEIQETQNANAYL